MEWLHHLFVVPLLLLLLVMLFSSCPASNPHLHTAACSSLTAAAHHALPAAAGAVQPLL
jgi:hypothetical protein